MQHKSISDNRVSGSRALLFALTLLLIFMIGIYLWGMNKGLDLIDEGDFLLTSTNPVLYPQPSSYAYLMNQLPVLIPDKLLNFRLASLLANLTSISLLVFAVSKWFSCQLWNFTERVAMSCVAVTTLMSSLLFATIFVPTIAYNVMTYFFVCVSTASLFWSCYLLDENAQMESANKTAVKSQSSLRVAPYMVASGIAVSFCIFTKFTTAFAFLFLFCIAIKLIAPSNRLNLFAYHAAGIAIGLALYFGVVEHPAECWRRIQTAIIDLEFFSSGSHSLSAVFANTKESTLKHSFEIAIALAMLITVLLIVRVIPQRYKLTSIRILPTATTIVLFTYWVWRGCAQHVWHSSVIYIPVVLVVLTSAGCFEATKFNKALPNGKSKTLIGLGFLALLPFVLSFGTNSPILWHAIGNIAPLITAVGLAAIIVCRENRSQTAFSISIFSLSCALLLQFINGFVFHSRNGTNLLANTTSISAPAKVANLKLKPELAAFLSVGNQALVEHGFQPGDPILALYDLPGLVWAVGGSSPSYSRYGAPFASQNAFYLSRLPKKDWQRFYLIVNTGSESQNLNANVTEHLHKAGLDFPSEFELIGTVFRPNQYWNGGTKAFFYALKH